MTIIEYKLHPAKPMGMKVPDFVVDGGYWNDPDTHTLIGTIPDGTKYYVPDTLTILTLEELQARQRAIHAKYPMTKRTGGDNMTDDEVNAVIKAWVDERS